MIDEQWAREHIGITPAVEEATEGVAMLAIQIRRAMAEEHISVTLPQNWVIPVLADRDKLEAENTELRAQLEILERRLIDVALRQVAFEDRETAESIARTGLGELIPVWKAPQRGGAVAVPESDRPTPEFVENYVEGFDPGERSAALFGWREGRADLRKSIQPIPASQVLQPGMVGVDREELMYLHAFEKYARKHGPESIQDVVGTLDHLRRALVHAQSGL